VGVEADLTEPTGNERLLAAAREAFGEVDILNGPGPKSGTAAHVSEPDVDAAIDTLLRPQVQLVSAVLPGMWERRWGRILAVGSTGISAPLPNLALSNLGRAALAGYLKTIAAEVAADGVTVNLLLPGRIATDRAAVLDEGRAERKRPLHRRCPEGVPCGDPGRPVRRSSRVRQRRRLPVQRTGLVRDRHGSALRRRPGPHSVIDSPRRWTPDDQGGSQPVRV
jgi:3-oxoacyl-[acyl-carrier protein] reductase